MITLQLSEEEAIEIANHTAFTAREAIEDNDEEAWRIGKVSVSILEKLEEAFPEMTEQKKFYCGKEVLILRRKVAAHQAKQKNN